MYHETSSRRPRSSQRDRARTGASRLQSSPRRRRLAGNLRSAGASEHLRDSSWVMGDLQALVGTDTFCLSFISERTVREQDKTPGQGAAVQDTARIGEQQSQGSYSARASVPIVTHVLLQACRGIL